MMPSFHNQWPIRKPAIMSSLLGQKTAVQTQLANEITFNDYHSVEFIAYLNITKNIDASQMTLS